MPAVHEHLATPALLDAYNKRLQANLEGICPECGATEGYSFIITV